jgi:hypothetical protein
MSPAPQDSFVPTHGTVGDVPEFDQKLSLICSECGKKANYKVGRILIDPEYFLNPQESSFEDAVSFSGLFRCKQCGSGGPWEFPVLTSMRLCVHLVTGPRNPEEATVHVGRMQLFDGTTTRSGAEAEDYLKEKLKEHPADAFLWSRLANAYDHADERKLARSAYEKAVEFDPAEIEANYKLGCYRMADGDRSGAAECFERVALHARSAPRRDPELLENIVRDSLSRLFDLHRETEGEIPFPPKFPRLPVPNVDPVADDKPHVVYISNIDLGSDEGWDMLTSICLNGKLPERTRPREKDGEVTSDLISTASGWSEESDPGDSQGGGATVRKSRRVGRNEKCPCGSGKKYKRCCGGA